MTEMSLIVTVKQPIQLNSNWSQVQQDTSGPDNFRILGCLSHLQRFNTKCQSMQEKSVEIAYFQKFKVQKGHNSCINWQKLMAFELDLTFINIKSYTKCQRNMSKHEGEKCGKLWRTDGGMVTRSDGRTKVGPVSILPYQNTSRPKTGV